MIRRFLVVVALVATLTPLVSVTAAEPASAERPIGFVPTVDDFVVQQYEDFLSRRPDAPGLAHWSGAIGAGLDPSALVEALAVSDEFEGVVAPVVRLYSAHFRRSPDFAGLTHWTAVARGGWSMAMISEEFVRSDEFAATYGGLSDREYVERVYRNVLGRDADLTGLRFWTDELASGVTRGSVMVAFSDSTEYRRATGGRVLATMLYVGMLRRVPEPGGLDYWSGVIESGTPFRDVIAGFLGAAEYGDRMATIYRHTAPLTGVASRVFPNHQALAVKIDNVDGARPQHNIDRADIVYEEQVEGQLTRLIAVFHSDLPDVVGPVRSVRTSDIDILSALGTPLLAASGANAGVLAVVDEADVINVNAIEAGGAYFRATSRRAPHNLYARSADLFAAAAGRGGLPPAQFRYRPAGVAPTVGTPSTGTVVEFGSATIEYRWSSVDHGWARRQNGTAHTTASGALLAPANVVVMTVEYTPSSVDARSPHAHTVGSGPVEVLTAGRTIVGTWRRASAADPITLTDADGRPILLTPGQTFVELAPAS